MIDPDVALTQMRVLVDELRDPDVTEKSVRVAAAIELADAVADLDEWLTSGGRAPSAWGNDAVAET